VVFYSEQVFFLVIRRREILSLQIVRNWLVRLESFTTGTISADSKVGGLSCLIELITIVLCSGNLSRLSQ